MTFTDSHLKFGNALMSRVCTAINLVCNGLLIACVSGCGDTPSTKTPKGNDAANAPTSQLSTGEVAARDKLKIALDSWKFGDDVAVFESDHPNIRLYDERSQITPFGLGFV